jgi:nicotinamide mononucleotide transporter
VFEAFVSESTRYLVHSWLEVLGVVTGLLSVWLTVRRVIWCWLWGIASVLAYTAVFWQTRLYADMGLQLVFCAMNVYGFALWSHGSVLDEAVHGISSISRTAFSVVVVVVVLSTVVCALMLAAFTDASLPAADAFLTSLSLAAVWMQARKYLENWLVWLVADTLYVAMFAYKSLWLTAGLYAVFCGMAVAGFVAWRGIMRTQNTSINLSYREISV